jgi:8-oxo-dGTP pyrophosphatase MutT (NUDIX family)
MKPQRQRVSAYALIHDVGRLLMCRLSHEVPRWEGFWTLPGGGLEFGEAPEQAMVREVEEETGLIVKPTSIAAIDSIHDSSGPSEFHGIRIMYHVEVIGGTLRHEVSGSTDFCDWQPLHPTPDIPLADLSEVAIRVAQRAWPVTHEGRQPQQPSL